MKRITLCLLAVLLLFALVSCHKDDHDEDNNEICCCPIVPHVKVASLEELVEKFSEVQSLKKETGTMTDKERSRFFRERAETDEQYLACMALHTWDCYFDVQLRSERYSLKEILVDDDSVTYTFKTESQEKPSVQVIIKRAKDFEERFGESAEDFFYRDHEKGARRFDINREGRYVMVILPISLGVETEEQLWELLSIEEIPLTPSEEATE